AAAAGRAGGRGVRVVGINGGGSEGRLPFAGLHELLRRFLDGLSRLPGVRQDALGAGRGRAALEAVEGGHARSLRDCSAVVWGGGGEGGRSVREGGGGGEGRGAAGRGRRRAVDRSVFGDGARVRSPQARDGAGAHVVRGPRRDRE